MDYSLLLTFVAFFLFIGNLGRVPAFSAWLGQVIAGREVLVSVLASQVTSNVPAALLLSGFTQDVQALIVGTNLGGLGTLIASMASLISYRQIAREEPEGKGRYFLLFTASTWFSWRPCWGCGRCWRNAKKNRCQAGPDGGSACRNATRSRGNPFLSAYAGQKFLPPGIPLGTKFWR